MTDELEVSSGRVSRSDELEALAARCEREEPDRVLDWCIYDVLLNKVGTGAYGNHPAYTTSLDAAVTLVPEGCKWSIQKAASAAKFNASVWGDARNPKDVAFNISAITAALALCAAALHVRSNSKAPHD